MRLDLMILADAVAAPPDGKFYIHGGGLTRVTAPQIPHLIPQLGLLLRLEVEDAEWGQTFLFRVDVTDPRGVEVGPPQQGFESALPDRPRFVEGEPHFVVLGMNIGNVPLPTAGLHHVRFFANGELLGEVPVAVVLADPTP